MDKKNQKDLKKSVPKKKPTKEVGEIIPKELKEAYKELHPEIEGVEKVVSIKRTAKVTKGGKKLHFGALVISGNKNGNVGYGFGKANEVPEAIRKSINSSKKNTINVPLKANTIPHEVVGRYGAAIVLLRPAVEGTGIIAGNIVRAICEAAGIKDVLTKSMKSQTPINVIKATFDALGKLRHKNELREPESATTEERK